MFAKIQIESPLPQLDRLFEYSVPPEMVPLLSAGVRVKVTVGHSKKLLDGFVVEISDSQEYQGAVGQIAQLVSGVSVLSKAILELANAVAARQAGTVSDILKTAVPNRSVAIEKRFQEKVVPQSTQKPAKKNPKLSAWLISPKAEKTEPFVPNWVSTLAAEAVKRVSNGSIICCLPDDRDLSVFRNYLEAQKIEYVDYSTTQTPAKRYESFLKSRFETNQLIIGNRSSLYAPVHDLDSIFVWDEFDYSHSDQAAPYAHSRDIALLRQSIEKCNLLFASYCFSTEIYRLVEMGYLNEISSSNWRPKIAYEEDAQKANSLAFRAIRTGLAKGPVLIQVSAVGTSVSLYCGTCQLKVHCNTCAGPLWLDPGGKPVCRWCSAMNLNVSCKNCKSKDIKQGRAGATRIVAEIGKAFPGVPICESTSSSPIANITNKPQIVVSTAGCEPIAEYGYQTVVFMDARNQLSWDSLRSVEESVHSWNGAVQLLANDGSAVLVGVGGKLAEYFALWRQNDISNDQLQERKELNLPPVVRLASVSGLPKAVEEVVNVIPKQLAEKLGPTMLPDGNLQYLLKYQYRTGSELAQILKAALLKTGASRSSDSSRVSRNVRVKMDDRQVI